MRTHPSLALQTAACLAAAAALVVASGWLQLSHGAESGHYDFPAGSCGYTPISETEVITAKHCFTAEKQIRWHQARHDWLIIEFRHGQPAREMAGYSYMELRKLGPVLSFADQSGCRALPFPLGDGAFLLDCEAKPGDSGSGVFFDERLVGVISGFNSEGQAIVTSATEFVNRGN